MIFHENYLLADDSHGTYLIFSKIRKDVAKKMSSAAVVIGALTWVSHWFLEQIMSILFLISSKIIEWTEVQVIHLLLFSFKKTTKKICPTVRLTFIPMPQAQIKSVWCYHISKRQRLSSSQAKGYISPLRSLCMPRTQYKRTGHWRKYAVMLSRLYFSAISTYYSQ